MCRSTKTEIYRPALDAAWNALGTGDVGRSSGRPRMVVSATRCRPNQHQHASEESCCGHCVPAAASRRAARPRRNTTLKALWAKRVADEHGHTGDRTQGLPHAKRVFYHYTMCPVDNILNLQNPRGVLVPQLPPCDQPHQEINREVQPLWTMRAGGETGHTGDRTHGLPHAERV